MKDRASIYTIYFKYKLDFNKYKSLTQVASGFSYLAQKQSDSSRYELWVLKRKPIVLHLNSFSFSLEIIRYLGVNKRYYEKVKTNYTFFNKY